VQKRLRDSFVNPVSTKEAAQLAQAEQFVQYVQAQRMYATLIERYNPGMGMSEEERVRLTARKVGMELPEEFLKSK
jgi:ATP synthase assembly factor FMC1